MATDDDINELFTFVMKGNWDEVLKRCKKNKQAQQEKLTKLGDTALHIAVSNGQTKTAVKLMENIDRDNLINIVNNKGNTPLHIAASLGNFELCETMAEKNHDLITLKNNEGETPLFLAALHGKEMAFLCLHSHCKDKSHSIRRNNGDTILHVALSGEYLSLAFRIIHNYSDLVNSRNVDGDSPLHVLASKPNAFKSSSLLGLYDRIVYHGIIVEELKEETLEIKEGYINQIAAQNKSPNYPENYKTWMNFLRLVRVLFQVLNFVAKAQNNKKWIASLPLKGRKKDNTDTATGDEENPPRTQQKSTLKEDGTPGASCSANDVVEESSAVRSTFTSNCDKQGEGRKTRSFPPNYSTFIRLFKFMMKIILLILGVGVWRIKKIKEKKERHVWAKQVMNKLVERTVLHKYEEPNEGILKPSKDGEKPEEIPCPSEEVKGRGNDGTEKGKGETPLLVAAKMGVTEMVEKILEKFPIAIQDLNFENKNVALLAIENRQPHVYSLLLNSKNTIKEVALRQLDNDGNSALHLAAKLSDYRPRLIPGSALQMQWEIKWYKFVKKSMPPRFFARYNEENKTPKQVFSKAHEKLVKDGSEWLTKTSESCSLVAALIAAVAFATSATVPGGINEETGEPALKEQPAFNAFAISSIIALCFSVTALVFFLSILTSRYQEKDFAKDLPRKLLLGLTSLFASIASILVSFCTGHVFVLKEELRPIVYPLYVATCFPITFFALAQLSLYFDLLSAIIKEVPQRSYKEFSH